MTDSKVYEMFWDCPYCGTTELLGKSHRHCPSCGAAQDPQKRYFPPDDRKVAVSDHVYVGRDLVCANCSTPNAAAAKHCVTCGSAIGDDDRGVTLVRDRDAAPPPTHRPLAAPPGLSRRSVIGMGTALAVILAIVAVTLFWTESRVLTVTGHEWERGIAVESFQRLSKSEWCDTMPADARSVRYSERQRGTRQVADGQECRTERVDRGDGTYTTRERCTTRYRSEPVYDDWCQFTVDRWALDREALASGAGLSPAPEWPSPHIRSCQGLGCERLGRKREVYSVLLLPTDAGPGAAPDRCDLAQPAWSAMEADSAWTAEVRVLGDSVVCDTLARASQ